MTIDQLKPYPNNPKKHSDDQILKVAKSIKEFGWRQPIVHRDGVIIIGHARYEAYRRYGGEMGLKDPWIVSADDLTEEQANALRLADNKLNESPWDMDKVIEELSQMDESIAKITAFDLDILKDVEEDDFDADTEYAKISEADSRVGEVYQLGPHRLMCGDSAKEDDVAKLMDGTLADMVFTDPPYNVNYNYAKYEAIDRGRKRKFEGGGKIFNDNRKPEEFQKFLEDVFRLVYKFSKDEMALYVCHATKTQEGFFTALKVAGFHFSQTIIWLKERIVLSLGQDYHRIYEPIWFGWKKGKKHYANKRITTEKEVWDLDRMDFEERLDVWYLHRDKSVDYEHPTQKPVRLPERAIKKSCLQGGGVV